MATTNLPSGLGPWCVGLRVVVRRVLPGESGPTGGPAMTDLIGMLEEWGETTVTVRADGGARVVVDRSEIVAGKPVPARPSVRLRVPVLEAELRAMDCWPAAETERLGDWVLRAASGFSTRANSALLVGDPGLPWPEAVHRVEGFYRARGLPVRVQTMTGAQETARLLQVGWVSARSSDAEVGFHLAAVARARRALHGLLPSQPPPVSLADAVTEGWLADDARARSHGQAALSVLQGPAQVAFAAVVDPSGAVVAKGRAALSERADVWLGISDLWVSADHRRRGLALTVLDALFAWGAEQGATTAYLQTPQDNTAALSLYKRLGFTVHHTYRYLQPPTASADTSSLR